MRSGEPKFRPSYAVGDLVVMYLSGADRCPAVASVEATAVFDPDEVSRGGRPDDGERWGWLTEIDVLDACDVADGPTLSDIGVDSRSMARRSRLKLTPEQFDTARRGINAS